MSYSGYPEQGHGTPTLYPEEPFDPRQDAEVLRVAMKGFGTDTTTIINVLARRTARQRQEIAVQFKTLFGKDLVHDLKSELSGNFEKLILAMMKPLDEFMVDELHHAMAGIGTDESTLIQFMCSATNAEIHAIKSLYFEKYRKTLENDLIGDTSGHFKRLMVSLCMGSRSEDPNVDEAAVYEDAMKLHEAGAIRFGTDESAFNAVLCQRSYPHIKAVMKTYEQISTKSLAHAVNAEFSGDIQRGLLAILECVEGRQWYFAQRLYKSMKGLGTDDRTLIRLVVSRCEVDMVEIKEEFQKAYGKTLGHFIKGDCSGNYKNCLLTLIGDQ